MENNMIAPSTFLKNALINAGANKDTTKGKALYDLLQLVDENILNGLAKHVQEKEQLLEKEEWRLKQQKDEVEKKLEETKRNIERIEKINELQDEKSRNAYKFAEKMVTLLSAPQVSSCVQNSMSYIMWAWFFGDKDKSEQMESFLERKLVEDN